MAARCTFRALHFGAIPCNSSRTGGTRCDFLGLETERIAAMEYEIADRPQLGEDDSYELFEARHPHRPRPAPLRAPRGDQRDRAVAIPEQEAGS
jgi:hypothetical protein